VNRVVVIELNPFLETTDGALFSWNYEMQNLKGKEDFSFRIVEQPRVGSKAMLPFGLKKLVDTKIL
jgi:hypothetical protein